MVQAASLYENHADNAPLDLDACLRLCRDPTMHQLNRDYRNQDKPTDVLAFATREGPGSHLYHKVLGDIIISVDTAARQATGSLDDELAFLASHGLCHLLGYDHQDRQQEAEMNQRMANLLAAARAPGKTAPA